MEFVDLILAKAPAFVFVLTRTMSILAAAPFFGANTVPIQLKMSLAVIISILVLPFTVEVLTPTGLVHLSLGLAGEVIIGLAIGLAIRFIFAGIEFGAQVASLQMGLGLASVYDPFNGAQIRVLGRFFSITLLLLFLSVNGHLMILLALKKCFDVIPPYGMALSGTFIENFILFSKEIFVLAVKFSAPIVAILIFVNVVLGILGRTVPQINIFAVGFPITISIGLVILAFSLPVFEQAARTTFANMWDGVSLLIRGMSHGG